MQTKNQTPAAFLAAQFLAAYKKAERTGEQIEEIIRLDVLADVARQVVADEERRAAADSLAPAWRIPADAHSTCELARMAEHAIARMPQNVEVWTVEVCDYVTACVHAFEAKHRATEWNEGEDAPDWTDAISEHWEEYTAAHRAPWDTDNVRRERDAEAMRAELRASGYLITGFDGCVEIRARDEDRITLTMECHGDGTCDVENHEANRYELHVPIATMITYARLMVRA